MRVWCVQKQNGDSLMEPHIPIRLTVDFSHTHCQVGWGGRRNGEVGWEGVGMRRRVGLNTVAAVQQEGAESRDPEVGILAHYTLVMMFIVHYALYER